MLMFPGFLSMYFSIPLYINRKTLMTTGIVVVFIPHILLISISRSLYFDSFSVTLTEVFRSDGMVIIIDYANYQNTGTILARFTAAVLLCSACRRAWNVVPCSSRLGTDRAVIEGVGLLLMLGRCLSLWWCFEGQFVLDQASSSFCAW